MSDSRNHPSLPTSEAGIELYHYYRDPAMASAQYNEGYETRSSILNSPDIHGLDAARPASFSFRSSVSLIPTPGAVSTRHPTYEPLLLRFWFVTLGCLLLGAIGVGLEIARVISKDNGGFHLPQKNVFSFASIQFLTSFIPSLLFVPLAIMFRAFDGSIRMWHPYLLLSRGNASADETILLNYIGDSRPYGIYNALKFKHRFIIISGLTALTSLLFQPMAGAVFSVKQLPRSSAATAQSIRTIGLSPEVTDLTSFAASAGYAEAAVFNNIADPSFIHNCWAIAEFVFPTNLYLNGTMGINTTGIKILPNCAIPNQLSVTSSNANSSTISATSVNGCSLRLSLNPNDAEQQYGVVNVPRCGTNTSDVAFQSVFFWFWQKSSNSTSAVFCQPAMELFDVTAFAALNNNSLTNVTIIDNYPKANNVSGPPLNGVTYNGLIFDASTDVNVQSRANSIRSGIPTAIFRQAQQAPGGLQSVFQNSSGFLGLTEQIYTQHLALAAKSNYFIPQNNTANAVLTELVPRLCVQSLAAHVLATICMGVASVVLVLHYMHFRQRRDVNLTHPPGSIGSAMALTAHSGFGELLLPYDNMEAFSRALAPLRFCLDRRTGAIVVDDNSIAYAGGLPASLMRSVRDETMMTLIGKDQPAGRKTSSVAETPWLVQSPD